MKAELIARIAHEINRAYCASLGDNSHECWEKASEQQRVSLLAGVQMHIDNPDLSPEDAHNAWLSHKLADGWKHGPVKDDTKREHPAMVPYEQLPQEQKSKDYLFGAVVHLLKDIPDVDEAVSTAVKTALDAERAKLGALPKAAAVAIEDRSLTPVKYIGRRDEWFDRVYDSGLRFVRDQIRYIPEDLARKLLRHPDTFKAPDPSEIGAPEKTKQPPQDDTKDLLDQGKKAKEAKDDSIGDVQDIHDQIDRMADKDSLLEFAFTNYKQKLNKQSKIETLRIQVKQLVDQFGVV